MSIDAVPGLALLLLLPFSFVNGILYVQRNEYRSYDELNGLWDFVREPKNSLGIGLANQWYFRDLRTFENATVMPVPSAFNDVSANASLRDHVGWVWYQREARLTRGLPLRIFLRFASANYFAIVVSSQTFNIIKGQYLNGREIGRHEGGHLPFEFEITDIIRADTANRITVALNNTLSWSTVPQGDFDYVQTQKEGLVRYPENFFKTKPTFDFFNYAGLLRSVYLVKMPREHIKDIRVRAEFNGGLSYTITLDAGPDTTVLVKVLDGAIVIHSAVGAVYSGTLSGIRPWWPRGMGQPNLYTLEVKLLKTGSDVVLDIYRLRFGFRTVFWNNDEIFINSRPFYCIGFGMHEDADIRGRGYDPVIMTKDLNLLEWMGANCFRTSHYPYSEERAFEADRRGIAVITETPAVALKVFSESNLRLHEQQLREMVARDYNHPSTIMWSLSNEPYSAQPEAREYFKTLIALARSLDNSRPLTIVYGHSKWFDDKTADLDFDVILLNMYIGWYTNVGYLDWINETLSRDITNWKKKFNKPQIFSEYGADSLAFLSEEPSIAFSVQYQDDLIKKTHEVLDELRVKRIVVGEMIWNFADFMTAQAPHRAVGNHKGVFTRNRQPKPAAYTLRKRYLKLLQQ